MVSPTNRKKSAGTWARARKIGYASPARRQWPRLPRSPLHAKRTGTAKVAAGAVTNSPATAALPWAIV